MIEQRYIDLMHASLDGELSGEQQAALDEFLAASDEGRSYLGELERLQRAIGQAEDPQPPADLRDRIVQSLPARTNRAAVAWRGPAFALAAGIVLAVGLVSIITPEDTDDLMHGATGTMAERASAPTSLKVSREGLEADVSLRWQEGALIVGIGLESNEPMTTRLEFPDDLLEISPHDDIDVSGGGFRIESIGKRRVSTRLEPRDAGQPISGKIRVSFVQGSTTIEEVELQVPPKG